MGGGGGGEDDEKREGESEEKHINKRFVFMHWCFCDLTCFLHVLINSVLHKTSQIHMPAHAHAYTQAQAENTSIVICSSYISSIAEKQVLEDIF